VPLASVIYEGSSEELATSNLSVDGDVDVGISMILAVSI
jgi:hypothetical protein